MLEREVARERYVSLLSEKVGYTGKVDFDVVERNSTYILSVVCDGGLENCWRAIDSLEEAIAESPPSLDDLQIQREWGSARDEIYRIYQNIVAPEIPETPEGVGLYSAIFSKIEEDNETTLNGALDKVSKQIKIMYDSLKMINDHQYKVKRLEEEKARHQDLTTDYIPKSVLGLQRSMGLEPFIEDPHDRPKVNALIEVGIWVLAMYEPVEHSDVSFDCSVTFPEWVKKEHGKGWGGLSYIEPDYWWKT